MPCFRMASAQEIGGVHGTRQRGPMMVLGQCVRQKDQPESIHRAALVVRWWPLCVRTVLALSWGTPDC